jgi:hypothetical protein
VASNNRPKSASLYNFRDLDLMLKIAAEGDYEGWIETAVLAETLGFGDNRFPVSQRLSWMRRYGMLDFDHQHHRWRLTDGGHRVTEARLRAAQKHTLEELPDEAMIEVMANVTSRYHLGSPMVAQMLRREFLYGTKAR